MRLLGIDFEATSVNAGTARIVEYGCALYDWDTKTILRLESEFVDPIEAIPSEITGITGITDDMVQEFGLSGRQPVDRVSDLIEQADYVVAHFGVLYDRPLFEAECARCMRLPPDRIWLDTSTDVRYPDRIKTRNLQYLAAEHGILNPFRHRAVFDVLTMMGILAHYPIEDVITRAKEPMICLEALVEFVDKEKAKERGYRWFPLKKIWWRNFKESDAIVERKECGFNTRILPEAPE